MSGRRDSTGRVSVREAAHIGAMRTAPCRFRVGELPRHCCDPFVSAATDRSDVALIAEAITRLLDCQRMLVEHRGEVDGRQRPVVAESRKDRTLEFSSQHLSITGSPGRHRSRSVVGSNRDRASMGAVAWTRRSTQVVSRSWCGVDYRSSHWWVIGVSLRAGLLLPEQEGSDSINGWRILSPWEPSSAFLPCDLVTRCSR